MEELEHKILLNPGPATTTKSVKEALVVNDICPREQEFGSLLKSIADGLIDIGKGGSDYHVSLFTASGTGAMEAMLTSAIGKSEKVLIITNGAYGFRMEAICKAFDLSYGTMCGFGEYPNAEKIDEALKVGSFTHLAMIHHETSTGMMNPLEEVSEVCKKHDVKFMVDAMSSFGGYPINLKESGIHYLVASSNKCIHGMAGLSFVIFHESCKKELAENSSGYYFDVLAQWENMTKKSQTRFTPPVQVCYAFKKAIDETLKETVDARWVRYQENWKILHDGFKDLGFQFFLPEKQQSKILLAIKPGQKLPNGFDHFHDYLFERNITVYPGVIPESNTFRVAVIGELYPDDMDYVISVIKEYFS